ncbi:MFS transporter, FHS family, L-fucose permease [Granulicella pectinivorans]|jgi:FHS family L-fucose permease-like MFS transporter|uniref:MFS transporter, FHS family, L-fucose permease n=1 Tax=Granulicella pectinivorans TaxID=474950 RepID=A0A1I6LNA7_9BACT|nr:sugar MFS transporter [Granulicella pectinivorans]SFS04984.1 MFS transporter, FHS family, L-fucose permease [Granulicella pectinivorans]
MAAPIQNVSAPGIGGNYEGKTDTLAMSVTTALFFMVGFLTCLNDVIIPHLKLIFELNYTKAMMVQFAFFSSYFVFSYPGGRLVEWLGYKRAMVIGLVVMAIGAAGFLPAADYALFPIFLTALIILAAGMTTVQVAVNPYVTIIGPPATASSRLNLSQAFNSVGTFIAPFLGSLYILRGVPTATPQVLNGMSDVARQAFRATQASSVRLPYIGMALVLLLLATALGLIKLKNHQQSAEVTQDFRPGAFGDNASETQSIWNKPWLLGGALGIFTYVGAEVSIGSLLVSYMGLPQIAGLGEATAAKFLMVYWGGAMLGRFIGSAVLQKVRTGPVVAFAGIVACLLVIMTVLTHGHTAMFALLAVGFCNSIMFPSIFTMGIQDLGSLTSRGSSLMIAAIVGGAIIPLATGKLADTIGLQNAFLLPAVCYVYIALYGMANAKRSPAIPA